MSPTNEEHVQHLLANLDTLSHISRYEVRLLSEHKMPLDEVIKHFPYEVNPNNTFDYAEYAATEEAALELIENFNQNCFCFEAYWIKRNTLGQIEEIYYRKVDAKNMSYTETKIKSDSITWRKD